MEDDSDEGLSVLVRAEQVRALYSKGLLPYLTNVINGGLIVAVLWDVIDHGFAVAWLIAFAAIASARIVLQRAYHRRSPPPTDAKRWGDVFAIGSSLFGSLWAIASIAFFVPGEPLDQVLLVFVIGGMCAGATTSAASYPRAFAAFTATAVVPTVILLAREGDRVHGVMAAMLALFAVAMSQIARNGARSLVDSATLRFRNAAMADRLRAARSDLEQLNAELEQRIAERTQQLETTLAQLARFHALLNHAGAAILVADASTLELLEANELAAKVMGREIPIATPLPELGIAGLATREDWLAAIERARTRVQTFEDTSTPRPRDITIAVHALSGRDYLLIAARDISERKALEAEVARNGLMASIGRLASGLGHELNNPLTAVLANLTVVDELIASGDTSHLRGALADAHTGANQVRRVVNDLRAFSCGGDRAEPIALNALIESCIELASNELKHRAVVIKELGAVPYVLADRARLSQVVLNLIINAAHSIAAGDAAHNEVHLRSGATTDGRAMFEITDTGPHIAPDALAHVFEPFFITQTEGFGPRLALSICQTIVHGFGGTIEVESVAGRGNTFRVLLPATATVELAKPAETAAVRRLRVLVIDDDPMIIRVIQRALGATHDVEVAMEGRTGIQRVLAASFDVILCDLMMPDATGMTVHAEVAKVAPDAAARMVFMTGGAFTRDAQAFLDAAKTPTLHKPFTPTVLRELVASVAGGSA